MEDLVKQKMSELLGKSFTDARDISVSPTLANVLLAMEPMAGTRLDEAGGYWEQRHNLLALWNLTKDYDHQTPEVKAFIGKLIRV